MVSGNSAFSTAEFLLLLYASVLKVNEMKTPPLAQVEFSNGLYTQSSGISVLMELGQVSDGLALADSPPIRLDTGRV